MDNKTPITLTPAQVADTRSGLRRYAEFIRDAAKTQEQIAHGYMNEERDKILRRAALNRRDADEIEQTLDLFRDATRVVIFKD
jgi:hypothetical protein